MKVSCNAKQGTDKKADKFWDDIVIHQLELFEKANSINEDNTEYSPLILPEIRVTL
jgi:hypothetical protein